MRIDIITVLPEMLEGFFNCSIMSRAQKKGLAEIHLHNLRDYAYDRYRKVDDYPFGGFAGMVMKIEPIDRCISALKAERDYDEVIFTSPDGEQFNQPMANSLSMAKNLIILCGHFKGIDYRIREHLITKEISIGDYVLTGGELAAAVIADAPDFTAQNTATCRVECHRPNVLRRRAEHVFQAALKLVCSFVGKRNCNDRPRRRRRKRTKSACLVCRFLIGISHLRFQEDHVILRDPIGHKIRV
jgi:hypothetical protein